MKQWLRVAWLKLFIESAPEHRANAQFGLECALDKQKRFWMVSGSPPARPL
jgi:hypothetical protein